MEAGDQDGGMNMTTLRLELKSMWSNGVRMVGMCQCYKLYTHYEQACTV